MDASNDQASAKRPGKKEFRHSHRSTKLLKEWLSSHMVHPYPTEDEKMQLSEITGMSVRQISYWFVNARRRNVFKPDQNSEGVSAIPAADSLPIAKPARVSSSNDMSPLDRWRHSPPRKNQCRGTLSINRYKDIICRHLPRSLTSRGSQHLGP
ncbi:Homeobox protein homothorax [Cladobotryum mycophilum]|uniref:Homeobox protein homothorax n=1 Tax=Cladobotryum mycophilum TaxID=491253 RepID=A0ABR0SQI2_9HYPO